MKIYAISDLHLSINTDKPMDVFGGVWEGYWEKIKEDWQLKVSDDDVVLISGDISWAINLKDALLDMLELNKLKGKKIIIRGNHDYWWSSYAKIQNMLPDSIKAIQNNALNIGDYVVCGTRNWLLPQSNSTPEDIKIYQREVIRLKLSLDDAKKKASNGEKIILMLHYPPFNVFFGDNELTRIIESYGVNAVVYGHLHGKDCRAKQLIEKGGIPYYLTSCDLCDNTLQLIF